jgi:hypothetical protein
MGGFLDITAANRSLWLNKTVIYSGALTPGQNPTLNLVGAVTSGDFFDVRNTSATFVLSVWNPYESGGFLMNILPGEFYRFTYTTSWAATANPTQTTQTSLNTFSLVQGWNNTILSTNNILTINAGLTNIIGFAQLGNTNITDLTAQQVKFSTSQTQTANISSFNASSFMLGNGSANTLNTNTVTASSITTSSITGCLFNSLVSTVATKAGIPGATQQLLNASVAIFSPIPTLNLTNLFTAGDTNYSYWNNNGFVAGTQALWFARIENLVVNTSAQVDFYIGDTAVNVQIVYPGGLTNIGNIASGLPQKVRFYFSGGTWFFTNVFSDTTLDNNNSLVINQNISQTSIQTTDSLVLSTSLLQIYGDTFLNNLIGQYFNVSTLSSINTNSGQINANLLSTNAIVTNSLVTNSLTTGSIITTAPLTVPSLSTTTISSSVVRAANFIASTRVTTPSISTLVSLNSYNTRLLNNPGNVLIYTEVFVGGNGSRRADIDTDPFVPGVYTCSAVCRNNQFRTLEATLYYNSRASVFCQNSQGFDNYNGQKWTASSGFVSFMSQTDGPGDTFDISIYMISGQYFAVGDDPPFPQPSTFFISSVTVNTGTPQPVTIGVSSFSGSTITMTADENISILANYSAPTYVSTGNITIAGTNIVGIIGDTMVVGGGTQTVIDCLTGDVNISAASTISMTAPRITAATAVIGTPSAFGNNYAYFGNSSRATNGGEYALLQENSGRTFLNATYLQTLHLRNGNYDIMTLDDTQIQAFKPLNMNGNNINNVSTITAPSGTTVRLQNNSGSGFFQLENGGNIYMVANGGATNGGMDSGLIFWAGQNIISKVFGATSAHTFEVYDGSAVLQNTVKINSNGLDMCNTAINNLSSIFFTQGAAITTNAATWTTGSITTLAGDHIGGGKFIKWNYDNNPGTEIADNHSINLNAPVINAVGNLDMCNNNIKTVGLFSRMLSATSVDQPILQFGEDNTGSGNTGSVVVNLPVSYTSASSYVAFASMEDSSPSEISVVRISATSIEIYWAKGGSGSHVIAWNTMGT